MEIYEAIKIVKERFTEKDFGIAPKILIDTIRGKGVSEAFIVYCKEKGYVKVE